MLNLIFVSECYNVIQCTGIVNNIITVNNYGMFFSSEPIISMVSSNDFDFVMLASK